MAKKVASNDYAFYSVLRYFYLDNKGTIRKNYKDVSKKILDYNDRLKNPKAYLRTPQFEALEMYIFIKEFLNNEKVKDIFADWYNKQNKFKNRNSYSVNIGLFDDLTADIYNDVFDMLSKQDQIYPNYIYALTMGIGKTVLMATCIFYEFIAASKHPDDNRFCHNALLFVPDKTVLETVIKDFKNLYSHFERVMPIEYAGFLASNLKLHFLNDNSTTLNTVDGSDFNIIISNTQKIILKEVHREKSPVEKLMNDPKQLSLELEGIDDFTAKLYGDLDDLKDEKEVTANQRFEKIIRLNQLGVYVDEAHHLFGADLKTSLSDSENSTSLRYTINKIAQVLERKATKLVSCYNFTGTPYVENKILPEVVYAYGLKEAIRGGYLKQVTLTGYDNVKNEEFIQKTLEDFFKYHSNSTYEGLKPKIAIFGASIDEVMNEIKPMVEGILNDNGIDLSTMLVNVGDSKYTKDTDIQDFNNLDIVGSEGNNKQVILLVNKGREGWNCRSLFSVALFRSPRSRIFVLQATMRCLRSITDMQQLAHVYLSKENMDILDDELKKNFNVTIKELTTNTDNKKEYSIKIIPPVKTLNLTNNKYTYDIEEKEIVSKFVFDVTRIDVEKYKSIEYRKDGIDDRFSATKKEFVSAENKQVSSYQLIFEVSKYLNMSPIVIKDILNQSGNLEEITKLISTYNQILYDELIPAVFNYLFNIKETIVTSERTVPLISYPKDKDHFVFRSSDELTIEVNDPLVKRYSNKSFHTDRYCFDSGPERKMFMDLLTSDNVKEVYFTGMFTGSENGLSVQYIDPESNLIRNYYPDILVYYTDGSVEIIEVKGDNKIDDKEVEAKAWAALNLASSSQMEYNIYKSSDIMAGRIEIKGFSK